MARTGSDGGPITERRRARIREVVAQRQMDLHVVLEDVWDRHNASAVLRSADAFGASGVHLLHRQDEWPEIGDASSGYTKRWTDLHHHTTPAELVADLRGRGMQIVATALRDGAVSYLDVDWTVPMAVVFGNEHRGVSEDLLALCDRCVVIPMAGFAQSLNISVCAGVVLGEVARQRRAAGVFEPEWSEGHEELFARWLEREERPRREVSLENRG